MVEFLLLAGLVAAGLTVAAIVGFMMLALRVTLWLVLLPFRLLLKALMIPIWLTWVAVGLAVGAVAVPAMLFVLAIVAVLGTAAAALALALPAIPFVLLGLLLWALFRRLPAAA